MEKQESPYDLMTDHYRLLRKKQYDPILDKSVKTKKHFKYGYKWDPITGERLGKDEDGPLCFDPEALIYYFYKNRLRNLWIDEKIENGDYIQGYYDVAVGAGPNIYIESRGYHPEKYLFRLPVIDCYLSKDIDNSIITMGPILTNEEIEELDKITGNGATYKKRYGLPKPSLCVMKFLYDMALDNTLDYEENKEAVNSLRIL